MDFFAEMFYNKYILMKRSMLMNLNEFVNRISSGALDEEFKTLYGPSDRNLLRNKARYLSAAENFSRLYPECGEIRVFSAPGRAEIGGNHTDHQNGCVLAAAIDLDIIAIAALNDEDVIRVKSEGCDTDEIKLDELGAVADEAGTSAALIRGIAAGFAENGTELSGLNIYTSSDVVKGGGLSSSAAFEVLTATIIDSFFNEVRSDPITIARIGQTAERSYFCKECGLMDQIVSAVGGFVYIDLHDPAEPEITAVPFDFARAGYSLCITDTRDSHIGLTKDYEDIVAEMRSVAEALGAEVLGECSEDEFYEKLPELREKCGDRAVLRAAHFFDDDRRAGLEAEALKTGDTEEFFRLVNESGHSSAELLQNTYSLSTPEKQGIGTAIMLSRRFLGENGAVRVHGGGFAGTVQAFVPTYLAEEYRREMERVFGEKSCRVLSIRTAGACEITI